jgi:hypothetical protein
VKLLARALITWVAIMILEVGNGLLRKVIVEPVVGDLAARQIGVVVGSLMAILVAYLLAGWLRLRKQPAMMMVGLTWAFLTITFEIVLGRVVMGLNWSRIWSDYDVPNGGLMPFGLLAMVLAPSIGSWLRRSVRTRRRRRRDRNLARR